MKTQSLRSMIFKTLAPLVMFFLAVMIGCAPTLNASKELVSVTVLPAKAPAWTYTITTRNVENLMEIEFVSESDLSDVLVISIPAVYELEKTYDGNRIKVALKGHLFHGRGFSQNQFRGMRLMLKSQNKEMKSGDIQILVKDFRGNITTLKDIAGPV